MLAEESFLSFEVCPGGDDKKRGHPDWKPSKTPPKGSDRKENPLSRRSHGADKNRPKPGKK